MSPDSRSSRIARIALLSSFAAVLATAGCGGSPGGEAPAPAPGTPSPPPPAPPPPAPPPPGSTYLTYPEFSAAAPEQNQVAPVGAIAWAAGTYYGRTNNGAPCTLSVTADGTISSTMEGSTVTATLNGESGDTWLQQKLVAMAFTVVASQGGQLVTVGGSGGRVLSSRISTLPSGTFCYTEFRSATPLAMTLTSSPVPLRTSGLLASDLPAWMQGTFSGYVSGTQVWPQPGGTAACQLTIAADGTMSVSTANGRAYTARINGGTDAGSSNLDRSTTEHPGNTGDTAFTGTVIGQSPNGSAMTEIEVEYAFTGERTQVTHVRARNGSPGSTELSGTTQMDACYFPN